MKKLLTIFIAVLSVMALTATVYATNITQSAAGELAITGGSGAGGALEFAPSPSVVMSGGSVAEAFAIAAEHQGAIGRPDGKAYGMASDATDVFWADVEPGSEVTGFVDTNSATLAGGDPWFTF